MKIKSTIFLFLFIVSCSINKKNSEKSESESNFIDSTDFKYFGLKKFDIQDWYDGKIELKTLSKEDASKYYQHRLRPNTSDNKTYYQFYSIQKNTDELKIITIIDGATGKFPDLRMLIYNKKDSLIGFYPVAGIGNEPDWNLKYRVTSNRINDTTYLSTRIEEYVGEFDLEKLRRDSTITKFAIGLGYKMEAKVLEKQKYELE
ncbi:hypothetical protein [Zobellia barbeyronii]|uniref:Lipoprotein n=1 Tax=Zobellia barbeyronii TaxID=2748009 RepID=A0ABS5WFU8_9FLAO|nr:hypothetical protein [Zobellia barbeyronii]MBT2162258.1 hypothetical protein [Zobellia barbeyronii]